MDKVSVFARDFVRVLVFLDRLVAPLPTRRALIYMSEEWRNTLPSVQRGFSPEFLDSLQKTRAGEYLAELAYRRGGVVTFKNLVETSEPLPSVRSASARSAS